MSEESDPKTRRRGEGAVELCIQSVLAILAVGLAGLQLMEGAVIGAGWGESVEGRAAVSVTARTTPYEHMFPGTDLVLDPVGIEVQVVSYDPVILQVSVSGDKELNSVDFAYSDGAGFLTAEQVRAHVPDAYVSSATADGPVCAQTLGGMSMESTATENPDGGFNCALTPASAIEAGIDPGVVVKTWIGFPENYTEQVTDIYFTSSLAVFASSVYQTGETYPQGPTDLTVMLPNECGCGTLVATSLEGDPVRGWTAIKSHGYAGENLIDLSWRWTTQLIPGWVYAIGATILVIVLTAGTFTRVAERWRRKDWLIFIMIALPIAYIGYMITVLSADWSRYWVTVWVGIALTLTALVLAGVAECISRQDRQTAAKAKANADARSGNPAKKGSATRGRR